MFSYNCEKCGREVPPSYSECPDCAEKEKRAGGAATATMPPPGYAPPQGPPQYAQQPPQYSPQQGVPIYPPPGQTYPQQTAPPYQQQPYPPQQPNAPYPQALENFAQAPPAYPQQTQPQQTWPPQPPQQTWAPPPPQPTPQPVAPPVARNPLPQAAGGTPGWVISLLVGGVLVLGGYILITKGLPWWRGDGSDSAAAETSDTTAAAATPASKSAAARANEELKYLEVTGLRLTEEGKKPQISMIVVNHSSVELTDMKATVLIHTTKDKPGAEPLAKLELKLGSIEPNDVRDIKMPFPTKLRAYELPDWQFLRAEIAAN